MNNDLISRKALKIKIRLTKFATKDIGILLELIDNAPTVEERPQGEWITQEGYDGDEFYECSVCKDAFMLMAGTPKENNYNYCPNCGADMRQPNKSVN